MWNKVEVGEKQTFQWKVEFSRLLQFESGTWRIKLNYWAAVEEKLCSGTFYIFLFLKYFSYVPGKRFQVFSYRVKGGSYLRGGRSSNEIRRLTKHYYLTKWRPQIKSLRLFNDFLPLFHVRLVLVSSSVLSSFCSRLQRADLVL